MTADRDRAFAAAVVAAVREVDDPPEWAVEYVTSSLSAAREEALAPLRELAEPGDPDARMDAYYYGFERTGIGLIDAILSAVASAGKAYHGTDMWAEEDEWTKPSHEARIQAAADAAAARVRACLPDPPPKETDHAD